MPMGLMRDTSNEHQRQDQQRCCGGDDPALSEGGNGDHDRVDGGRADRADEGPDRAVDVDKLGAGDKIALTGLTGDQGPGGDGTLTYLVNALGINALAPLSDAKRPEMKREIDEDSRQKRQFDELVEFTQELLAASATKRDQFWSKASRSSVDEWTASSEFYRDYVWEEMIGKLPAPTIPPMPIRLARTRGERSICCFKPKVSGLASLRPRGSTSTTR